MTLCRMCKSKDLRLFLDLGATAPADDFLTEEELVAPQTAYPLQVMSCGGCGLVQLGHVVDPEILYRKNYPYEASVTRAGRRHWDEFAATVCTMMALGPDDLVVDFGSNVGVLLEMFTLRGPRALGIDPAPNIVAIANERRVETLCGFFNTRTATATLALKGQAKVITATNVFAHINDLDEVMAALDSLLTPDGAFIVEAPSLANLVRHLEYDTIYHEHLSYISVKPLAAFLARFSMHIFDIHEKDIHGGSIRIFIRRDGAPGPDTTDAVARHLKIEDKEGVYDMARLARFAEDVAENRSQIRRLIGGLKDQGKRIVGVSAPAKGMTLLNYCDLGKDVLDFVTEKSRLKIGKFTPGLHIPVLPDEALIERKPDYALLLAWNFAEEIMGNLSEYRDAGGKFIIPIPTPRIVE
jgi:2-polyprenyl-3-methyl-5-hydroxy-6-metoxy-1,4-benzoquinol methylase